MQTPRARNLLWMVTALSLSGGAALLLAAMMWPLGMPSGDDVDGTAVASSTTRPVQAPPLASFASAWSRDLRQPLENVPRGTMAAIPAAASSLPVRLVGTIIDPARPRGIFMTRLGQMELRAVGEKAGGVEILKIDERSATVSVSGQPVVLKIEKVEFLSPGGDPAQSPSARSHEKGVIP
jgi:hypothetical protein